MKFCLTLNIIHLVTLFWEVTGYLSPQGLMRKEERGFPQNLGSADSKGLAHAASH